MTQSADPPAVPTVPTTSSRLLYVDNLRTALTVLVVIHHAAITYSTIPLWFYREPATDSSAAFLDVLLVLNQSFFMGAFFLISGLFVPGAHDRKGAGRFLGERLLRLGVPLLAWLLVVRAMATIGRYTIARDAALAQGSDLPYWQYYLTAWNLGPMWFVEVLLVFSALYVLWRRLVPTRDRPTSGSGSVAGRAPGGIAVVGFTVGLAVATWLWRIAIPLDSHLAGLPTPGYLPQYAALFVVGLVAARRGWTAGLSRTAGRIGFAVAAVAAVALVLSIAAAGQTYAGGGTWPSLVTATCESALAVGAVIGLLVLFRERLDRQGRHLRFLSVHAYTVYLIHPVVLVAVSYALSGVPAPVVVKAVLLFAIAAPLCWALAVPVRALPGARRVL